MIPFVWHRLLSRKSVLGVLALALLAYSNSFPGTFILDDHGIVAFNPLVQHPDLYTILRSDYWGPELNSGLYRPLTILSLALNRVLLGSAPWGFHLVNVLLHAGVSVLLYVALRRWDFSGAVALLAAAIFAVHPLHTEVVNEVVGRSELLAALLLLAALVFARGQARRSNVLVVVCFALALLAKEHAITLLAILPLCDAVAARRWACWRQRWPLYAALITVAILWLAWRQFGLLPGARPEIAHPVFVPLFYLDPFERIIGAVQLQWLYFGKLLLPWRLQAVYSGPNFFTPGLTALTPLAVLALLGALCAWGLAALGTWRLRSIGLAALLYLIASLPTANILFPISVNFAERLTYFPSVWFSLLVAAALVGALRRLRGDWSLRLAGGAYVLLLLIICLARNPAFADEVRLWRTDVRTDPHNVVAWYYLAQLHRSRGELLESDQAYRQVQAIAPDFSPDLNGTAAALIAAGRIEAGLRLAARAVHDPHNDVETSKLVLAWGHLQLQDYRQALYWLDRIAPAERASDDYRHLRNLALRGMDSRGEALR